MRTNRKLLSLILLIISVFFTYYYTIPIKCNSYETEPKMSYEQALHDVYSFLKKGCRIKVTETEFIIYGDDGHTSIYPFKDMRGPVAKRAFLGGYVVELKSGGGGTFNFEDESSAKKFALAVDYIKRNAGQYAQYAEKKRRNETEKTVPGDDLKDLSVFREKAKTWRYLEVKPPLPPEANRYWVLAEDAFQNKDFDKAIDYYEKGLKIYPTWPEGQFNVSLIYGEKERYAEAVDHMNRYLLLAPDAKDARTARDKIIVWEEKAK